MSAMPTDSYSLTFHPLSYAVSNRVDAAGDFVAWHTRILYPRPDAVLDQDIAVANPTCFHLDANLPRTWFGSVAFNQFKTTAWLTNLRCFHQCFFLAPFCLSKTRDDQNCAADRDEIFE